MRLYIPWQMRVHRSLLTRHLDRFSCLPIFEQDEIVHLDSQEPLLMLVENLLIVDADPYSI